MLKRLIPMILRKGGVLFMNCYDPHGSPTDSRVAVTPFAAYHALILSGIRPGYESLIERRLRLMGNPYGSRARAASCGILLADDIKVHGFLVHMPDLLLLQ